MTTYYAKSLEDVISSATAPFNPGIDQLWWKLPENMLYIWNGLTWIQSTALAASDPTKANINSPAFTGVPTAPTAPPLTNSIQIATTAFVRANSLTDAVADGQTYGRKNKTWSPIPAGMPEAPTDGQQYGRVGQTAAWTSIAPNPTWATLTGKPVTFPPTLPITQADVTNLTTDLGLKVAKAGDTLTGKLIGAASTSTAAPINLPHGTTPTIPANGDIWTMNTGLYARINGVTIGPLSAASSGGINDAANDGQTYGRKNLGWVPLAGGGGIPEANTDDGLYARINANWLDLNPRFALKANLVSPVFTGNPTGPTPLPGNNSLSLATTAFVSAAIASLTAATYVGDVPPGNPAPGQLWWESDTGNLFLYYNDGTGPAQWVPATAQAGVQGATGSGGAGDWNTLANKPVSFPPTLPIAQSGITNLITDLSGKAPVVHTHSFYALTERPTVFPPSAHTHYTGDITGLDAALAAKEPSLPAGGTTSTFLRGDKTWAVPAGGGGAGVTDGDKGDIVVSGSGATWMLDASIVTPAAKSVLDDTTVAAMLATLGGAPLVHTHAQSDITNLVSALAGKEPSLPAGGTTFNYLRGDKTWAEIETGGLSLNYEYMFDPGTAEPVSSANVEFNAATGAATTKIWVHDISSLGKDNGNIFTLFSQGDRLYFQDKDDSTKWQAFDLTGPTVDKGAYTEFPVAFRNGGGELPAQRIVFIIEGKGSTGTAGMDEATADARYVNITGDTLTGKLTVPVSGASGAGLNIGGAGAAPTGGVDGDIWMTSSGFGYRTGNTNYTAMNLQQSQTITGTKTFSGKPIMRTTDASGASLNMPHGVAPTTPVNGDMWTTTAGTYVRINGVTIGPLTDKIYVDAQDALKEPAIAAGNPAYFWAGDKTWKAAPTGTGGGGAATAISDTAPGSPTAGQLWWESDTGKLFIWYEDIDNGQWVQAAASAATPKISVSATAPTSPAVNDLWVDIS